jgi:hypothetical protein
MQSADTIRSRLFESRKYGLLGSKACQPAGRMQARYLLHRSFAMIWRHFAAGNFGKLAASRSLLSPATLAAGRFETRAGSRPFRQWTK